MIRKSGALSCERSWSAENAKIYAMQSKTIALKRIDPQVVGRAKKIRRTKPPVWLEESVCFRLVDP